MTYLWVAHKTRHGGDKALGIFRLWIAKYLVSGASVDDSPPAHNYDAITDVTNNTEIMRDEEITYAEVVLQIAEQVQDLGLDRDVERRNRFIADDYGRIWCDRAGDRNALTLTARELERSSVQQGLG
ncbi:hypothetical protein SAMN05216573_12230 [Bradyrhizobium sp. Rc3b]|nr:hypothetical protein SAMN05216573_12230 [Bradyrhizobium sp. Rc3b]